MEGVIKQLAKILKISLLAMAFVVLFGVSPSHAANGADFQAGRIIDDNIFTNQSSMSVADIQNFLNSKVPTCDTNGTQPSEWGGGTRAQYGTSVGYPPPYTCLKNYVENGLSSAQIIYNAAQAYSINPQVLLVTLQKENGLITDSWPFPSQYRTAMGFGCPDGAPCDSQWYGFTNQVNQGARHFRGYYDVSLQYVPYRTGINYVQFNPNANCGGTNINIITRGTAALYSYTPYQPNGPALNNLYGTGDGCSAYGNRNFWRDFNDWFGNSLIRPYSATYAGQSAYPTIAPGGSAPAFIQYQNTGNIAWYDDTSRSSGPSGTLPTHLSTNNPINRASIFGATWGSDRNRPANNFSAVYESDGTTLASNQHVVQPGQIGKFSFTFTTNTNQPAGSYNEYFRPVLEGSLDGAFTYTNVWLVVGVQALYQSAWVGQGPSPALHPTESYTSYMSYRNTGNIAWYDDHSSYFAPIGTMPVHLATSHPINRASIFGATWGSDRNRPANNFSAVYESDGTTLASNQHVVQPGQIGKFSFTFTTNTNQPALTSTEYFQPIVEGGTTMNDPGTYLTPSVTSLPAGASIQGSLQINMTPGQTRDFVASFTNVGNTTWTPSTVFLQPDGSYSTLQYKANNWPSSTKASILNESSVAPGQVGTFNYSITAPANTGSYRVSFAPGDGTTGFGNPNVIINTTVQAPRYSATYAGQSTYPTIAPGGSASAFIQYQNTGNVAWYDDTSRSSGPAGTLPTHLATNNPINRASIFGATWGSDRNRPANNFSAVYESDGTTLASNQHVVQPGQIGKFSFTFTTNTNQPAGSYNEYFRPVLEGSSDGAFTYTNVWLVVGVQAPRYSATYAGQSAYPTIAPGGSAPAFIQYQNTGNIAWYDDTSRSSGPSGTLPTHLSTNNPINRASIFGATWGSDRNRPANNFSAVYESDGTTLASNQHVVQPGQIGKFSFTFTTNTNQPAGSYNEYFRPVLEGSLDGAFTYTNVWLVVGVTR